MIQTPTTTAAGRRRFLGATAAAAATLPFGRVYAADTWPSRQLEVIVAYVAGGQGDLFARLIGERLSRALGQTNVVENRPGGSGALGARLVAKAKPDGYTLLLGQTGEMAVNASVMREPGYDTQKDFRAVALVGDAPLVMGAPANARYNTITELLDFARKNPDAVSYGSSGTATPGHLAAAALALATKTNMTHVPYKGGGQAITDLIGGHVQFFFSSPSAILPQVKGGLLKALAVSAPHRMPALPNVPTVAEAAVPGFEFSLWGGYFAPRATPDAIVVRLNSEINKILVDPEIHARLVNESSAITPISAAQFDAFVKAEGEKYARIVKAAGVHID
jgi:tripartite-type tricarboxylate transporter receptor subunit TctC